MSANGDIRLPVLHRDDDRRAGTRMGRRRAIVLVVVHLLVALHVAHYLATGSTLSPLEPSEAGHTLSTGAINAGAIFFALMIVSTLVLGRFFCGWACHLVAYQDASRWLLVKLGLRPKTVRVRLLMLVPLFGVYWLFVKPIVDHLGDDPAALDVRLALTSEDFWATFPGPAISILTFVVTGFVVIWFLGAKGFCTYGCPYGAVFGAADRVAVGRIRVNDDCRHTGNCTRTCSSNVDVAREVALYGQVVDPGCMKCMDCVAGCPHDALRFSFERPKGRARAPKPKRERSWEYTWPEEIAMALLFVGAFWTWYHLYRVVPFLLALGIGVLVAVITVTAARLVYRRDVTFQRFTLKRSGRATVAGGVFGFGAVVVLAATAHGAYLQHWTRAAGDAWGEAHDARARAVMQPEREAAFRAEYDDASARATDAFDRAAWWSPFFVRGFGRMRGELARWHGDAERAIAFYDEELAQSWHHPAVPMQRGLAMLDLGRADEAWASIEQSFTPKRFSRDRLMMLSWELQRTAARHPSAEVRYAAIEMDLRGLRLGLERRPADADLALRLCRYLVREAPPSLRDPDEALAIAEDVSSRTVHADLLALLAWIYAEQDRIEDAVAAAEASYEAARAAGDRALADEMEVMVQHYRARLGSR